MTRVYVFLARFESGADRKGAVAGQSRCQQQTLESAIRDYPSRQDWWRLPPWLPAPTLGIPYHGNVKSKVCSTKEAAIRAG